MSLRYSTRLTHPRTTPAAHSEVRTLALFLAVGAIGLAADASVFSALYAVGLSRPAARALSLLLATGVTWSLNRAFTFASSGRGAGSEFGRYACVALGAQGTSYAIFLFISWTVPAAPALAALVIGAVLATALSFAGQRLVTFRARSGRPHTKDLQNAAR